MKPLKLFRSKEQSQVDHPGDSFDSMKKISRKH